MNRGRLGLVALYALLVCVAASVAFPLLWIGSTSLKPTEDIVVTPPTIIPPHPTLSPYVTMTKFRPFGKFSVNSIIVSVSATVAAIAVSSLAAYSFARFRFRGQRFFLLFIIVSQMLPGTSILIPLFRVILELRLIDTRLGLIIIYTGFATPLCTWLLTGYFRSIPADMEDAALIDGCSRLGVLVRIVLPLAAPAIAAVAMFAFLISWNEFLFALIFTRTEAAQTIPVGLGGFIGQYANRWNELAAASVVFGVPPIVLFVLLQRQFVAGLTAGAVKE